MVKNSEYLFNGEIDGWDSWGNIFQSIEAWGALVNFILEKENLPVSKIENLHPGTNAVFKSGDYVVKIFYPKESGYDGSGEYRTEKFGLSFAHSHGVPVSKLVTYGEVKDKYDFSYMVLDYIGGVDFEKASADFNDIEKTAFAKRLREITDLMNKPCENFNGIDAIFDVKRHKRWGKYSERFKSERLDYIKSHDFGEKVFIHGDLCEDNIIIDNKGEVYIIDFADALLAPQCYEYAHVAIELFGFDKTYLRGYFGEYRADKLADICFDGILIHDFGGDIANRRIAKSDEINCLADLRGKIYGLLK